MPSSPCLELGCSSFAEYRGRCAIHSKDRERETHRTGRMYPNSGRLYKKAKWIRTSLKQRDVRPFCEACLAEGIETLADQVDHIIPIEQGGEPWALSNLQSLCASHHARKTRREQLA